MPVIGVWRGLLQGSVHDDARRVSEPPRAMDAATERALGVLTSSKLIEALDVSKEPDRVRERYGDGKPYKFQFDGAPTVNDAESPSPVRRRSMAVPLEPPSAPRYRRQDPFHRRRRGKTGSQA